ncbi:hypothetical protein P8452_51845 [Trifolium repens]|nr:hypothetical protein P8452_51845 [Trifolium repens]
MVMLSFMSLGVGNSSCCKVKLRTRLCLVSCLWVLESQSKKHNKQRFVRLCLVLCLWVLEIQAKNLEKEHTQIWNKKIWKCD